ncbi:hypothetical protein KRMM14A1259_13800 [Krasilnikovia sp. MM14-A1259]
MTGGGSPGIRRVEDPADRIVRWDGRRGADDDAHGRGPESHDSWNQRVRGETPTQRLDRCYAELLQEVRLAQAGVQLLLACQLSLAFTPRFAVLTDDQRHLYVVGLVLSCAAAAMLIAPAPFHRMLFQQRLKRQVVVAAGRFVLCGLLLMLLAMGAALMLILSVVVDGRLAVGVSAATMSWCAMWWYAVPLVRRIRRTRRIASVTAVTDRRRG